MGKRKALAAHLGEKKRDITVTTYDENTYDAPGAEYMVLTDEEADEKCAEYIKETLWAFNADFILDECGLDGSGVDSLRTMQSEACEGANDFILSLIEGTCGLEEFTESAVSADGRGHFMSSYDGNEDESAGFYIYRVN
jgi:hypothetical protein